MRINNNNYDTNEEDNLAYLVGLLGLLLDATISNSAGSL
jgi:hypothetical protein